MKQTRVQHELNFKSKQQYTHMYRIWQPLFDVRALSYYAINKIHQQQ